MNRIKIFSLCLLCFLCGCLSVLTYNHIEKGDNADKPGVINFTPWQRIILGIDAFKKMVREDGSIIYKIDLTNKYLYHNNNVVREMGSAYSLSYAYWLLHDASLQPVLKNIINHISSISVKNSFFTYITDDEGQINAGATALALITILYYEQEAKDTSFKELRESLKGALISLYHPQEGIWTAPDNSDISPYYEGETWLALAVYDYFHPNNEEINEILSNISELMNNKYGDYFDEAFFHWGIQAASIQMKSHKNSLLYEFIKKQLDVFDDIEIELSSGFCSYTEALAEAAMVLKDIDDEMYIKTFVRLNKQLAVTQELQDAAFNAYADGKISNAMSKYLGLFLHAPDDLIARNDYTQHCLTAMLKSFRLSSSDN